MEGFKSNTKMQCYKEGGAVKQYKSRHSEKTEMKEDVAQDKKIVKKAVKMHDEQLHGGKETNLAKLKKGGRMKKEGGCVGRYKSGGKVGKYQAGGMITEEEKARMPAGKLPQQVVDEEAMASNTETREMVAGPLRKLKRGVMEKFKSKSKTPVEPMKEGGSLKEIDTEENPGLAKLPTNVRNKMGYAKKGGKVC